MLRRCDFEHYRLNQGIIERLELDPCIVSDTVTGCSVEPPYGKHTIKISGTSERRLRRNERIIKELEARCAAVDDVIATIPDRRMAKMLMMRYVEGPVMCEWEEISREVGMHPDNCRKAVTKYVKSFDEVDTEGFRKPAGLKEKGFM